MNVILDYISRNYIVLALLSSFIIILTANRKNKIEGTQYAWYILIIIFALTVLEYIEDWCSVYNKSVRILYFKTTLLYWLYPLTALLQIYLIVPVKRKLLIAVPHLINMMLTFADLFGTRLVYYFEEDYTFKEGFFRPLPLIVSGFYVLYLTVCSLKIISRGDLSKGLIVTFMCVLTLLTTASEYTDFAVGYTESIAVIDMLLYYFYLSAIQYVEIQTKLYNRELELAQSRLALEESKSQTLMAQIQPHFINNSLMAIRARCFDYPEIYESITDFSRYLRSNFEALGDARLILFEQEMDNIEAYLSLEKANFGDRLNIDYDIDFDDFLIPALSVQPLVENAVRHGVGTYDKGGTVTISVHRNGGNIIVEVRDDGSGRKDITEQQNKRRGIGIENVRKRLKCMTDGRLDIISGEHGTTARITIADPQMKKESEEK